MSLSIIKYGTVFTVKVKKRDTGSNYNLFAHLYKPNDKMPIAGTSFKENTSSEELKQWALKTLNLFNIDFLKN